MTLHVQRTAKRVREQPYEDQEDVPPAKKAPQVVKIGAPPRLPSLPLGRAPIAPAVNAHSTPAALSIPTSSAPPESSVGLSGAPTAAAFVAPLDSIAGGSGNASGSAPEASSRLGTGMYPIPLPERKPRSEPRPPIKPALTFAPETAPSSASEPTAQGATKEAVVDSEADAGAAKHGKSGGRGSGGRYAATGTQQKSTRGGRKGQQVKCSKPLALIPS